MSVQEKEPTNAEPIHLDTPDTTMKLASLWMCCSLDPKGGGCFEPPEKMADANPPTASGIRPPAGVTATADPLYVASKRSV